MFVQYVHMLNSANGVDPKLTCTAAARRTGSCLARVACPTAVCPRWQQRPCSRSSRHDAQVSASQPDLGRRTSVRQDTTRHACSEVIVITSKPRFQFRASRYPLKN